MNGSFPSTSLCIQQNSFLQSSLLKSDQKMGITGCLPAGPSTEDKRKEEKQLEDADFFSSLIFFCGSKFTWSPLGRTVRDVSPLPAASEAESKQGQS